MRKRRWLTVLIVVVLLGLGYTTYSLFIHTGSDYVTVTGLRSEAKSFYGQSVAVEGRIVPGSINWDSKTMVMRFALSDDKQNLSVVYNGIVPDEFKPGADLIVRGKYQPDDVFQAVSFGRRRSLCNLCH